ncbi:MAG: hypothetical protein WB714_08535 [Candidatus Sulfotelmatobacter sp.]
MSLTETKDVTTSDGQTRQLARKPHALRTTTTLAILLLVLGAARTEAAELKQKTLQAWEAYVQTANLAMEERAAGRSSPFLWVDESPDLLRRVRSGELVVSNRDHPEVPAGLIQHWVGAMFLPRVTLDEVNAVFNDYDHYPDFYRPRIGKVKVLTQKDDYQKITMLVVQRACGVTAAVEAENEVHIIKLDARRIYSLSNATRVQEIVDYGQPEERLPSENQGPGYVWRTVSMNRLEQRDGGVYIEMEMISLSRGIPIGIGWLIKPLVEHMPRTVMLETLKDTRNAVTERSKRDSGQDQKVAQSGESQ